MYKKADIIKALLDMCLSSLDDEKVEGAMILASKILGVSEDEIATMIYDGVPEDSENQDELLWNILKDHYGNNVEIAIYGDPEDPANIALEDTDTNEVILDAELYTICARRKKEEE